MALVKTSSDVLEIRGRLGGVYFKKGPDGQHVQAMPRTVNYKRSASQQGGFGEGSPFTASGITGFSGATLLWLLALLAYYALAWADYGVQYYFTKPGQRGKKITGFNWYIHYALAFAEAERPPFFAPPQSPGSLPTYLVIYKGMWTYHHSPDEWGNEVCSGNYYVGGFYNGRPTYRDDRFGWWLWWKDPEWVLSRVLGVEEPGTTLYKTGADPLGSYLNLVLDTEAIVHWGNVPP